LKLIFHRLKIANLQSHRGIIRMW